MLSGVAFSRARKRFQERGERFSGARADSREQLLDLPLPDVVALAPKIGGDVRGAPLGMDTKDLRDRVLECPRGRLVVLAPPLEQGAVRPRQPSTLGTPELLAHGR